MGTHDGHLVTKKTVNLATGGNRSVTPGHACSLRIQFGRGSLFNVVPDVNGKPHKPIVILGAGSF